MNEFLYESTVSEYAPKNIVSQLMISEIQVTQQYLLTQILSLIIGVYSVGENNANKSQITNKENNTHRLFYKNSEIGNFNLKKNINMSHLSNQTINNGIKTAIKLSNQLEYIQTQLIRIYAQGNCIVRTFCQAGFTYLTQLKDYFSKMLGKVTLIEDNSQKFPTKLTFLSLNKILNDTRAPIQMLLKCINSCNIPSQIKPQSINLLDKMWQVQKQILPYSIPQQGPFNKIFARTLCSYLRLIKKYFMMRPISQNSDFFILDFEKKGIFADQKKLISQNFLHNNDQILQTKLPFLLQNHSKGILQIGKTIRFITLYYQNHQRQQLFEYFNFDKQFQIIQQIFEEAPYSIIHKVKVNRKNINQRLKQKKNKKYFIQKQQIPDDNPYQMFTVATGNFQLLQIHKINKQIENQNQICISNDHQLPENNSIKTSLKLKNALSQMLENINKKCLVFFKKIDEQYISQGYLPKRLQENRIQKSITRTLIGIKKFMLLQQGDFLQQFFNCASEILDERKAFVTHSKAYNFIQEALHNSSANSIPQQITSAVHFDFIKYPNKDNDKLKFWLTFCFRYQLEGPISYIFTSTMMQKLKSINNLIFCIKKNQTLVNSYWQCPHESFSKLDRNTKTLKNNSMRLLKRQQILRNSLQSLLNSLLSYMVFNIDNLWSEYLESIEVCFTIFQIIEQSQNIVNKLYELSINDRVFHNSVMMTLTLMQKFRKFELLMSDPTILVHITQIEDMEFSLRNIVDVAVKVQGLRGVIDFNQFYYGHQ